VCPVFPMRANINVIEVELLKKLPRLPDRMAILNAFVARMNVDKSWQPIRSPIWSTDCGRMGMNRATSAMTRGRRDVWGEAAWLTCSVSAAIETVIWN
jgi:hypothetical protein